MTTADTVRPIIVGYDGSEAAGQALRWALTEGKLRGWPVHVLQVFEWPVNVSPSEWSWLSDDQRNDAATQLEKAVVEAGGGAEQVSIVEGLVVGSLLAHAKQAAMLVVGERGSNPLADLLLGSVSASVAVHATCPVVVVRGRDRVRSHFPILVGVDDSPHAQAAAMFAFAEASAHQCEVVVVRAWRPDGDPAGEAETAERSALREYLAPVIEAYPEVKWSIRLVADRPAIALIVASHDARLMVVGHRGGGGFAELLLGSVAHQLLHHSYCPVAIVR